MFIGWKLVLKVAISILVISHKNVEGKENEEEDARIREANHPLISLKDWFQWVSDPTSKCEDSFKRGMFYRFHSCNFGCILLEHNDY